MTVKDLRPGMYFDTSFYSSFSCLIVAVFPSEHGNNTVNVTCLYNDGRISTVPHYTDTDTFMDPTMWTNFFE
jgi:hypothetical protein